MFYILFPCFFCSAFSYRKETKEPHFLYLLLSVQFCERRRIGQPFFPAFSFAFGGTFPFGKFPTSRVVNRISAQNTLVSIIGAINL